MTVSTRIYRISPERVDRSSLLEIASVLRGGGLVAFPTETVYGLGAIVSNREAVRRIYSVKGRPIDNPLIVHVSSVEMFLDVVESPPSELVELAKKFWPGPLTVVWWKREEVPSEVTAGLPKVAVRAPAHPVALGLIESVGEAIAAPSANRSGKPSPTLAEHVISDLYGLVEVIIDGGETLYGIESTIVDFTAEPPRLLRPGAVPVEDVERFLGREVEVPPFARGLAEASVAEAPGTRYRHYAPESQLVVVETEDYSSKLGALVEKVVELVRGASEKYERVAVICSSETCSEYSSLGVNLYEVGSRNNLFLVARNLFKTLRKLDEDGVEFAVVEGFEERGLGLAIMNRLRKASGFNVVRA